MAKSNVGEGDKEKEKVKGEMPNEEEDEEEEEYGNEIERLEESLEMLDTCTEVIETFGELKPFSILGFKVETGTVAFVFSTGATFYSALYGLYSNGQ